MEVTKGQVKEAIQAIQSAASLYKSFSNIEGAIALIGNLDSTRESLEKKVKELTAEVSGLEGSKAKAKDILAEQGRKLDEKRISTLAGIEAEAEKERDKLKAGHDRLASGLSGEIAQLQTGKREMIQLIVDLAKDRDGIAEDIKGLKESQITEQARLDAILGKIADLKSRL